MQLLLQGAGARSPSMSMHTGIDGRYRETVFPLCRGSAPRPLCVLAWHTSSISSFRYWISRAKESAFSVSSRFFLSSRPCSSRSEPCSALFFCR
ncbi:hypothetical protein EYF80_048877 [Liparis tanakae]|uniref:Uncharacterized protein n=1 Tax=Liparis tanakae TaxID=230148 RepID=A0A4Z2FIB6_9TELE|nr:hypothetical protein EYF80_048877 [Liparis tanakae]